MTKWSMASDWRCGKIDGIMQERRGRGNESKDTDGFIDSFLAFG